MIEEPGNVFTVYRDSWSRGEGASNMVDGERACFLAFFLRQLCGIPLAVAARADMPADFLDGGPLAEYLRRDARARVQAWSPSETRTLRMQMIRFFGRNVAQVGPPRSLAGLAVMVNDAPDTMFVDGNPDGRYRESMLRTVARATGFEAEFVDGRWNTLRIENQEQ